MSGWRPIAGAAVLCLIALGCGGCGDGPAADPPPPAAEPPAAVFHDATDEAGIRFVHDNAASPRRYLPETMGAGVALFDYDGDDRADVYLVGTGPAPGTPGADTAGAGARGALYRNLGGGRFEEVTESAGLAVPFAGMGAAVGDYDNDGWTDLLVTAVGGDRLFRNRGDGGFDDITAAAGLGDADPSFGSGFGSGAAFVDVDGDGWLDLVAGRYVTWSAAGDVECSPDGVHRTYCTPEVYPGASNRLYRNVEASDAGSIGGRRFIDATETAGLLHPDGKTLGVAVFDHDADGDPDLAMANDTTRNALFVNRGDGTFDERAVAAGFAFSPSGATRGGMGIASGDLSGDGRTDLVIGNFSQEMAAFYRATGGDRTSRRYSDDAAQAGLGLPTLMTLAFGTLAFDYDGDGALDVLFANGHIEPQIARSRRLQTYAQRPQLFRNEGDRFTEVRGPAGSALETPYVGRGLAAADLDGDGDLDLVLTQNGGPARLLRNDSPPRSWLRLRFVGRRSNRTGYGVRVTAVAGERRWVRTLTSGGSYLSASEPVLTLGLGDLERLDRLEVRWPSGSVQTIDAPELGRLLVVEEPTD